MKTHLILEIARTMLRGVRLDHLIGPEGPTRECWDSLTSGTMSSGERVLVALAVAMLDYKPDRVSVTDLMKLDDANLRRVGDALLSLADSRGSGRRIVVTHPRFR